MMAIQVQPSVLPLQNSTIQEWPTAHQSRIGISPNAYRYFKFVAYEDFDRSITSSKAVYRIDLFDFEGNDLLEGGLDSLVDTRQSVQPDTGYAYYGQQKSVYKIIVGGDYLRLGTADGLHPYTPASVFDKANRFNFIPRYLADNRTRIPTEFTIDLGRSVRLASAQMSIGKLQLSLCPPYIDIYASNIPFSGTGVPSNSDKVGEFNRGDMFMSPHYLEGINPAGSGYFPTSESPAPPELTREVTTGVFEPEPIPLGPEVYRTEFNVSGGANNWITEGHLVTEPLYPISAANSQTTLSIDTSGGANAYFGQSSLKWELPELSGVANGFHQLLFANTTSSNVGDGAGWVTSLPDAGTFAKYGISIPQGKMWIYSVQIKTSQTSTTSNDPLDSNFAHRLSYYTYHDGVVKSGFATDFHGKYEFETNQFNPNMSLDDFVRCYGTIDLRDSSASSILLGVQAYRDSTQLTKTSWYDAIQLEESSSSRIVPAAFSDPDNLHVDEFSRFISDGKILAHYTPNENGYGPDPSITPKFNLPNLTPHGDFWIDTANNNILFQYHQNNSNHTTRSAFHANNVQHKIDTDDSGWYSTEDLRTANAIATSYSALIDAETAQAAADREINAFFVNSDATVPTATGNGDVWIHTDNVIFNDPSPFVGSAINTGAIFVANTKGGGSYASGDFQWHKSPNNAIGRMYVDSYIAGRRYSDGRVVTHYSNNFSGYGPNPNTTPLGIDNPYPDGDFWVDTSNNNVLFRYNQNTSINYGQTAFWSTSYLHNFNSSDGESGWYAIEDPRTATNEAYNANNQLFINFAFSNIAFVNGAAYNAQAAADLARISADREILAYFQIHSDVPRGNRKW